MDRLPNEIFVDILEHLKGQIAPLASLSHSWQDAIEPFTFRRLKVISSDFDQLSAAFQGKNIKRREYLKAIEVRFKLPEESEDVCCDAGRKSDPAAARQALSRDMSRLFAVLYDISSRAPRTPGLELTFKDAFRLSDKKFAYQNGCYKDRHSRRQITAARASRELSLNGAQHLPTLAGVSALRISHRSGHNEELLSKMSGLKSLGLYLEDDGSWSWEKRIGRRQQLAALIQQLESDHIREWRWYTVHFSPWDEEAPVDHLAPQGGVDSLTTAVRHMATFPALTVLHLTGCTVISPDFFSQLLDNSGEVFFPALRDFRLDFAFETADGRWFLVRDEEAFTKAQQNPEYAEYFSHNISDGTNSQESSDNEEDTDEESKYYRDRTRYNEATFTPLLVAAARAIGSMRNLKRCIIRMKDYGQRIDPRSGSGLSYPFLSRIFELWFVRAGTPRSEPSKYPKVIDEDLILYLDRLYWRVGDATLPTDVKDAWEGIMEPGGKVVYFSEKLRIPYYGGVYYDFGQYGFFDYHKPGSKWDPLDS